MERARDVPGDSATASEFPARAGSRNTRVLVVEDEHDIAALIKHALERSGDVQASIVGSGDAALRAVAENPPDLIILDLNLPVLSGTEVCRILRGRPETANLPVIMLTARTAESDRVTGLDLGADDYVTKPFSLRELSARVRAVLRRRTTMAGAKPAVYTSGRLMADFDAVAVSVDGAAVRLTRREFELLRFFVENKNRVRFARPSPRARLGLRPLHRNAVGRRPCRPPARQARSGRARRSKRWSVSATASSTDPAQPSRVVDQPRPSSASTSASIRIRARSTRCQSR